MSADPNPTPDIVAVDPVPNPEEASPHIPAAPEPEIVVATPEQVAEALEVLNAAQTGEVVTLKTETVVVPTDRVSYIQDPLMVYDQETVNIIVDQQVKVDELLEDYEAKNQEAREAKKKHEAAVEQLQELIRERKKNRGKPVQKTLFDVLPPPPPIEGVKADAEPTELEKRLADLWREYPLERFTRFGMTETDIQKLADGQRKGGFDPFPIRTVGQMADYTANAHGTPGHQNHLADFKGVGPGVATRIENANLEFWAWWNARGLNEYATERGIISATQAEPGVGTADPQQPGGEGGGGEPAGPGAAELEGASIGDVQFTEPQPESAPAEEQFVIPEGEGDEYSLGVEGPADGEVHGAQEGGAVPEVPESEDNG